MWALAVEILENWIEAVCCLNMDLLAEQEKERIRRIEEDA